MATIRQNSIQVVWRGAEDTEAGLRMLPAKARRGAIKGLEAISLLLQNRARRGIQKGPKTGRLYRRRAIPHRASAPGEFPATDTGFLVTSVIAHVDMESLEAVLSSGILYAKWLELGTRKMSPRPFLVPTLKSVSKDAPRLLKKTIEVELNNG